ncbi:3-dehydroquinate synthase [Gloeomargarita lithophora Alchichica-D10]|uniref:3-dehydroquinate synthase n=1 Tax=Gloeomargarita lithophora Alchichica-D10 TaxID=1188229 RepID=A0A1J0AGA9_9CYAN|nr:3-dehydroquinate synthase [Gloeomargarita lithophora]APB34957.1 3-dehydroquinate synthase [Gloeomargarita lithophora Alchichica-D10]
MPIIVSLDERSYPIYISPQSLHRTGELLIDIGGKGKVLIVSNPVIFRHYGEIVFTALITLGFEVQTCILPAGERYKNLKTIERIYQHCAQYRLERRSTIIALGGGVIGDMAGFAAATWLRGINFVQIPTTLLAMVDAAIGGKTGVNHAQGKNLIGAFYQPKAVVIDPNVLQTLPVREYRSGMAEVIKYGVIWEPELFNLLESQPQLSQYRYLATQDLEKILYFSCQTKATIVSQDEREGGIRALLNYGHTIGHAIETVTQYRYYTHGEAVALGMIAAGDIAVQLGWWSKDEQSRQKQLIANVKLPIQLKPDIDLEAIKLALNWDKKVVQGAVRFILPKKIGQAAMTDQVPPDVIHQALICLIAQ